MNDVGKGARMLKLFFVFQTWRGDVFFPCGGGGPPRVGVPGGGGLPRIPRGERIMARYKTLFFSKKKVGYILKGENEVCAKERRRFQEEKN